MLHCRTHNLSTDKFQVGVVTTFTGLQGSIRTPRAEIRDQISTSMLTDWRRSAILRMASLYMRSPATTLQFSFIHCRICPCCCKHRRNVACQ